MALLWLLIGAVLVVIGAIFSVQNTQPVNLTFFNYALYGVPLWVVGAVPAAAGLFLGWLLNVPARVRHVFMHRRLSGQVEEREQLIGKLKQRVADLERDLEIHRRSPVVAGRVLHDETPEVPPPLVDTSRSHLNAA